jgi:hypothetical protein
METLGCLYGLITPSTKDTSATIISRALALIHGLIDARIRESGVITKCTVRVYSTGLTVVKFIAGNIEMTRNMDMVRYAGPMAESMLGSGHMANSMDLDNILIQGERLCKESGIWVKESSEISLSFI